MANGFNTFIDQYKTRPLTLVAVGKTGKGKSSTMNSLATFMSKKNGKKTIHFASAEGPDSATNAVTVQEFAPPGYPKCRLVDTIGLFDTKLTSSDQKGLNLRNLSFADEEHRRVLQQFIEVMQLCQEGIDAFLFVVKAKDRSTKEEFETIDIIFRYLGWKMLDYVIFVVTGKDESALQSFEQWRQGICEFLEQRNYSRDQVKDRFIFVDNMNPSDSQSVELLSMVAYVNQLNQAQPYTGLAFETAQQALEEEKQKIREEFQRQFDQKVDEQLKPIQERHEAELSKMQNNIAQLEDEQAKLRDDQVLERQQFQAQIDAEKKKQEDEKQRMEREMNRQIQILEKQKQEGYDKKWTGMESIIKLMTEDMRESRKQMNELVKSSMETQRACIEAANKPNPGICSVM